VTRRAPPADLFGHIARFDALVAAARRAVAGKRRKPAAAAFMANLETECLRLERELAQGRWRPGGYVTIRVTDPKPRLVSAAPFRDRVVHHALCAAIGPILERSLIDDTFANRTGKGTHRAVARYERFRDRHAHVVRCDVWRYFPAIDHAFLKADLARRIGCRETLRLCARIVDGSNPQEPVELHFPGDDLLTPLERRRGLPIGNLTSQLFANLYLDRLDHVVKEALRAPGYVRYIDDFALFHDDPVVLAAWRARIERFLAGRRLVLHPEKTWVARTSAATEFLGYVLEPGRRRLPEAKVSRFRNRLRRLPPTRAAPPISVRSTRTVACRLAGGGRTPARRPGPRRGDERARDRSASGPARLPGAGANIARIRGTARGGALRLLERCAWHVLEMALADGDWRAAAFVGDQRHRGSNPARSLAKSVIDAQARGRRRQARQALRPRSAAPPLGSARDPRPRLPWPICPSRKRVSLSRPRPKASSLPSPAAPMR
jgi:retron-type reverse transcriptase